jgi:hypothetical protein
MRNKKKLELLKPYFVVVTLRQIIGSGGNQRNGREIDPSPFHKPTNASVVHVFKVGM